MDHFSIVRTEHLNGHGFLFGGVMLQWVDEFAYITAINEFPTAKLVTRGMDKVEFTRSVNNGALLRFHVTRTRLGTSSASYLVEVYSRDVHHTDERPVFSTTVTMVAVDADGHKVPLSNHLLRKPEES